MSVRGALAGFLSCLAVLLAPPSAADDRPSRIVSTHLCGDQLLLLLADRDRLRSISFFATDPDLSQLADLAKGLPRNRGLAEEILPLAPDIVFAGAFAARPTVHLLRRLGVKVAEVPTAVTFDDIRQNIPHFRAVHFDHALGSLQG